MKHTALRTSNGTLRRPSKSPLSRTNSPEVSDSDNEKQIADEMNQQLQREQRENMQASRMKPVKKTDKSMAKKEQLTSIPAPANRPNKSRFPSLTGLRGSALKTENAAAQPPKTPVASKVGPKSTAQPLTQNVEESMSSSPESDDESSSSNDEDTNKTGQLSQNSSQMTPKPKSGPIRGFREIMKRTCPVRS